MPQTKYYCRDCYSTKFVPERPLEAKPRIRTGCSTCGIISTHSPVGSVY